MVSDEVEINALDRARCIEEGRPIPPRLMTDLELESYRHQERNQKREEPKEENPILDSEGRPFFDEDGLSIDYDD